MTIVKAADYGIKPNCDITEQLIDLSEKLKNIDGEKTVTFEKSTYYIDSKKCKKYILYITNTVGDKEYSKKETPHLNTVALYIKDVDNLTFDANNSVFMIDGKATNIVLDNCKNITIKNLEIRHKHPDMHEFKVINKDTFYVDFEIDRDTQYIIEHGKLFFYGNDYKKRIKPSSTYRWPWIGLIREATSNNIKRVTHPLLYGMKTKLIRDRVIRCYYYKKTSRFKLGDCFYVFDLRRQFAGIFADKCKNIVLDNIKQRFNYSLATVFQSCSNISILNSTFAPEEGSARKMASVADFIQVCMCRGDVVIRNNYFDGAGDDCLNVHGMHLKIIDINQSENKMTVRYMHPQSHGYNSFEPGDTIAFINTKTLCEFGQTVIKDSKLINEYDIELTVDSVENAVTGEVIEDISACPNVYFENNEMNRIITRGLLLTTRGKVVVENNRFINTTMSSILLSDDAKSWYESGMCKDVTIKNNIIDFCAQTPILIKPENLIHKKAVHENINIIGNEFKQYDGYCISAKSTDNILIKDNKFNSDKIIKQNNCQNVKIDQ